MDVRAPSIMVVDDEPVVRDLLNILLAREGFRVVLAADWIEAEAAVTHGEPIDVALVDVHLAGMDGLDLLLVLRRHVPDIAAVMMTADYPSPTLRQQTAQLGCQLLFKPFSRRELLSAVRRVLSRQSSG